MASSSSSPEVEVVVAAMVVKEPPEPSEKKDPSETKDPSEFILRKYLLMLATLVATVTYGVGFNPPGGAWQDSVGGHLAGDPIVRTTNNLRYLVFFYCNAMALASSVLVIVLFLLLSIDLVENKVVWVSIRPLRVVMVLDLLSFLGAYAAGSCRDTVTTVYTAVLMAAGVSTYITVQAVLTRGQGGGPEPPPPPHLPVPLPADQDNKTVVVQLQLKEEERLRKALMLLATFALSITYVSGLNSPGGFWDSTWGGHHPGDVILRKSRLTTFFVCNTTAFMSSLLIIMLLLGRKLHERKTTVLSREMLACVVAVLVGLVGAYAAGSCREGGATAYVTLVVAAGLVGLLLVRTCTPSSLHNKDEDGHHLAERVCRYCCRFSVAFPTGTHRMEDGEYTRRVESARSLLLLLATFAMAITYPAGLDPPGGVWQDNNDGHLAGDPILLTSNAIRYKIFFYCNSIAFVAPLTTVVLFVFNVLKIFRGVSVQAVIMLELFGLVGAYAAGACRDMSTSIHVMALGGAVQFYVVVHVIFFWKGPADHQHQELVELDKKRKLLYLLATLSTAVSYQAGLNPPAGFWLQDDDDDDKKHAAGNPVLLYNHPGRYHAFFYCNSLSFMLSVTTMILLMNPDLYRPAIRSGALTLCTVAGLCCLLGAYAAGSTQYLTTSIGIFVFMAVAFFIVVIVSLIFFLTAVRISKSDEDGERPASAIGSQQGNIANLRYTKQRKKIMLMGILVAGVTYQAGLDQPGGVWQSGAGAGGPVMRDNRKQRYLAFFYSNSTSFAASIVMLLLLLLHPQKQHRQQVWRLRLPLHIRVLQSVVMLNLLALLVAYASGSSRDWRSSLSIAGLAIAFPAYIVIDLVVSVFWRRD